MRVLGELSEGMQGVRRELDSASESRKTMYERIEAQNHDIAAIAFKVEASAATTALSRDAVKDLADKIGELDVSKLEKMTRTWDKISEDLPKVVEEHKSVRKLGQALVWLLSIGGASILAFAYFLGDLFTQWVKHWLGIGGP